MALGARQKFQFFRQITWFLRKKGVMHWFKYWILYHLISIIKSVKPNFILTT